MLKPKRSFSLPFSFANLIKSFAMLVSASASEILIVPPSEFMKSELSSSSAATSRQKELNFLICSGGKSAASSAREINGWCPR